MKNKVLILYPEKNDIQSEILYEELVKLGTEVIYLPFRTDDNDNCSHGFYMDKGTITYLGYNLQNLRAVFIRALAFSIPSNLPAYLSKSEYAIWRAKFIEENIRFSWMFSMLNILRSRGALIVNHPETYHLHNTKAQFLSLLYDKGFSVPEFIATNDYKSAKDFCRQHECVCKSAFGIGATRLVSEESLHPLCGLNRTPAIFQKKVRGETIRVHTVGSKVVLSLRILSQAIDSRSDTGGFTVIDLPEHIEKEISCINREFKIFYSAWDIILGENETFHILDINPGPYIGWTGNYFARYVMSALARFIGAYEDEVSFETAWSIIELPKIRFSRVFANNTDFTISYTDKYCSGLRIRH